MIPPYLNETFTFLKALYGLLSINALYLSMALCPLIPNSLFANLYWHLKDQTFLVAASEAMRIDFHYS